MIPETKIRRTENFQNLEWNLDSKQGQPVPDAALNQSLLLDIREQLRSVRRVLIFFTVLTVVGIVLMFIQIVIR